MKQTGTSAFAWSVESAAGGTVSLTFEGRALEVPAGITVAAAVLGHEATHFCSSAADGDKRAPYCLMGVCFECLVEINGVPNRQACLEEVSDGMVIRRQHPEPREQSI